MDTQIMIPFKDKTFCASPDCKNECGRKMTNEDKEHFEKMNETMWVGVMQGYFCGEPDYE